MTGIPKITCTGLLIGAALVLPLAAQGPGFDTSGNGKLQGTYYFRQVIYEISTNSDSQGIAGDTQDAIAVYGHIAFDGNGAYSMPDAIVADAAAGGQVDPLSCYLAQTFCTTGAAVSGTYSVSASGQGFISSPVIKGDFITGLVSANGIFAGSDTETTFSLSDLFIAAPVGSPQPGNSTFQGSYTVVGYLPPEGVGSTSPLDSADVFFQMNADGNGNLGTVAISGYFGGGGTQTISQSSPNVKYFFSNGAAVVGFPTDSSATLLNGQEYLYFSPDGSFFFGGSPSATTGFEMLIGVRNATGTQNFSGLYYEAGLDQDVSQLNSGFANFDGYYGSMKTSGGAAVIHQRLNSVFSNAALGSTFAATLPQPVTGTYTDTAASVQYAVGAGGAIRIGQGIAPFLGISLALQAPTFTPTGAVYLDPTGVVNAASFSPFTAGISNGEFLTLYGTNLAAGSVTASSVPYPPTLGNVQVTINGIPAPIYYVTPGQIAVIAPAGNTFSVAQIQVTNNGVPSNIVTVPVNQTAPGVFTLSNSGLGDAAAVHSNGTIISPSNPAHAGEEIAVFLTGLGIVFPPVPDGAPPPLSPLSSTTNVITAAVAGTNALVGYAGLAPTLAGLYQVNLQIPTNAAAGENVLAIGGPDSFAAQSLIAIGGGTATPAPTVESRALPRPRVRTAGTPRRPLPCLFGHTQTCPAM
jgi:uncharacterized protein (TIGR03437 family)